MNAYLQGIPRSVFDVAAELPVGSYDSWLLQTEMISRGLPTQRLPKNALLLKTVAGNDRLAFIDGESTYTSFAADSICRSLSSWRSLLRREHLSVPRGISIQRNVGNRLSRFTSSVGLPVSLGVHSDQHRFRNYYYVTAADEFESAVSSLRSKDRNTRLFVEELHGSFYLDCLVVGSEVYSVLKSAIGIKSVRQPVEVVDDVHPDLIQYAAFTLKCIPGLDHGSVVLQVSDPASSARRQRVSVADISVAPRLSERQGHPSDSSPVPRLIEHYLRRVGVSLVAPESPTAARVAISGVVEGDGFVMELRSLLQTYELSLMDDHIAEEHDGTISLTLNGSPGSIALLALTLIRGTPESHRAHMVTTECMAN